MIRNLESVLQCQSPAIINTVNLVDGILGKGHELGSDVILGAQQILVYQIGICTDCTLLGIPLQLVLTQDECQLLGYLDKGKRKRKERAGSLQWAYMAIARLGGFMDSKRTGIASWGALWEGWEALQSKLDGFLAAKDLMAQGIKI